MEKRHIHIQLSILILIFTALTSCNKFLEKKSDDKLSTPTTLDDFSALLNLTGNMNVDFISAGEVSADDYFLTDADYNGLFFESDKRQYTWQPDYVTRTYAEAGDEWYYTFRSIYVCNSVLQGLKDNNLQGSAADNIKGQALAFRAIRYLDAVQIWAPVYNKQTAAKDLGMVIRLDPDMSIPSKRFSVQETYDQIIKDLNVAVELLPSKQAGLALPSKPVALGYLARAYLFMGDYDKALKNAESALSYYDYLIDFNTLDLEANYPIPAENLSSKEVLFRGSMFFAYPLSIAIAKISPDLYNLYDQNDLRKEVYFKKGTDGYYTFRGTHSGGQGLVTSITTSELYLICAECYTRIGELSKAADVLNKLLIKRYKTGSLKPISFNDKNEALIVIKKERRKELVRRGLRWPDLKRYNRDGANITLKRTVNGETYTLEPNDLRYALPIPEDIIEVSGIQQNPR